MTDRELDVPTTILAEHLGETDPDAVGRLRVIIEGRGVYETDRLVSELREMLAAADAAGDVLDAQTVKRLHGNRWRWGLFRADGTRRTVGGSFFNLADQSSRRVVPVAPAPNPRTGRSRRSA